MIAGTNNEKHDMSITLGRYENPKNVRRKNVYFQNEQVYAAYYRSNNTLYYNSNFYGSTHIIIFN